MQRRSLEFSLKGIFVPLFTALVFNFLLLLTFDMFGEGQKQGQHEAISEGGETYVVRCGDSPVGGISEVSVCPL